MDSTSSIKAIQLFFWLYVQLCLMCFSTTHLSFSIYLPHPTNLGFLNSTNSFYTLWCIFIWITVTGGLCAQQIAYPVEGNSLTIVLTSTHHHATCRWVHLRVGRKVSIFTSNKIYLLKFPHDLLIDKIVKD